MKPRRKIEQIDPVLSIIVWALIIALLVLAVVSEKKPAPEKKCFKIGVSEEELREIEFN
jgi:hypothetical protein